MKGVPISILDSIIWKPFLRLFSLTAVVLTLTACPPPVVGDDAGTDPEDAGTVVEDAGTVIDDAGTVVDDAGTVVDDAGAAVDDAGPGFFDAGPRVCEPSMTPPTFGFDGVDDLGKLPAEQIPIPGAVDQPWERFGFTWDDDFFYFVMVGLTLEDPYAPLHIYLEASNVPQISPPASGKSYGGISNLSFSPTHLVAVRGDDFGLADPYNGLYSAADNYGFPVMPLPLGLASFRALDAHTLSVSVPRAALGCPDFLNLQAHIANPAVAANEWKDTVPDTHEPWAMGGGFYQIDLASLPVATWVLR